MSSRPMWSAVVMIIAGVIFIAASNTGGRSSKLGLIVGCAIIVLGVFRAMQSRGNAPG